MISFAAAATTGGVKRFSIPNWSVGPNLPQALPGGPLGSSGSDEKGGCGAVRPGLRTLSEDMVLGFGKGRDKISYSLPRWFIGLHSRFGHHFR